MDVFCNGCGMCCKLIPVRSGDNMLVRDGLQKADEKFLANLCKLSNEAARQIDNEYVERIRAIFPDVKFYSCKHLSNGNNCTLNEKFAICKNYPSSPMALVPECCNFVGSTFIKNEELKRKIRMIKEEILDYETLIAVGDKDSASYKKIVENLYRFIAKYKDFGAEYW